MAGGPCHVKQFVEALEKSRLPLNLAQIRLPKQRGKRPRHFRVEHLPSLFADEFRGAIVGPGVFVDTLAGQRIVDIHDMHDPRRGRDLIASRRDRDIREPSQFS